MNKQEQVQQMTTYMANFVSHIAKVLPDDIIAKLDELGAQEDAPLSKVIYETMKRNQKLAKDHRQRYSIFLVHPRKLKRKLSKRTSKSSSSA